MGKKAKVFKPGDYVFAKVKGYPAWPAKISSLNGKKYNIYFYGTGETGNLLANDIFDYFEHKKQFLSKNLKRRDYNEGLAQIEYETSEAGITSNGERPDVTEESEDLDSTKDKTSVTEGDQTVDAETTADELNQSQGAAPESAKAQKKTSDTNESSPESSVKEKTSEETETVKDASESERIEEGGDSAIEQGPEEAASALTSDAPATAAAAENAILASTSTARGRKSMNKTSGTPRSPRKGVKQEVMSPAYEPHIPVPESVSRSGRKIKPKRHFEEETTEAGNAQTPATKKIKTQPVTPASHSEEDISLSLDTSETVNVLAASNSVQKGRKKVNKSQSKMFNVISDDELENVHDFLMENSEHQIKIENILVAILPSGDMVGVKLFVGRPETFSSPEVESEWMQKSIADSISLKDDLESGRTKPETFAHKLETDLSILGDEVSSIKKKKENEIRIKKLKALKAEYKTLELKNKIMACLSFDSPPDETCCELLNEIFELDISRVILLKHPEVTHIIRQIRKYIGNLEKWNLNEEETAQFKERASAIRDKATMCYAKFMSLFGTKDVETFKDRFNEQLLKFTALTAHMTKKQLLELMDEPIGMELMNTMDSTTTVEENSNENKKTSVKNTSKKNNSPKSSITEKTA